MPYRQCKLTELLFSNSFAPTLRSQPQKAIMIVTADPLGDFNATSQILRYSALAREVTVPRIPSVTSTIFSGSTQLASKNTSAVTSSGRTTPYLAGIEELELAASEIARLSEECDLLSVRLTEEEIRANEAELQWRSAEERAERIEMEIREEVWGEVEARLEDERRRWMGARDEEREMNEGFLDKKIELLGKTVHVFEDPQLTPSKRAEELERENEELRMKVKALEREIQGRSPTRSPVKPKKWKPVPGGGADENVPLTLIDLADSGDEGASIMLAGSVSSLQLGDRSMNANCGASSIRVDAPPRTEKTPMRSPSKKVRKLTTRKWDLGPEEEIP
jgi:hypothetical protein